MDNTLITPVGPGGSRWVPDPPDVGSSRVGPASVGLGSKDPTEGPTQGPTQRPTDLLQISPVGPTDGDPPALWPGFDVTRDCAFAVAWCDLWSRLGDDWMPLAELQHAVAEAHDLQPKTIYNMIKTAQINHHIEKKGGYSHRTKIDNRQIRRQAGVTR